MAAPLAQQLEELLNPRPDLRDPEDDAEEGERGSEKGSVRVGAGRVGQGPAASCRAGAARGARGASAAAAAAAAAAGGGGVGPECDSAVCRPAALRGGRPGCARGSARSHAALLALRVRPRLRARSAAGRDGSRGKLPEKRSGRRPAERRSCRAGPDEHLRSSVGGRRRRRGGEAALRYRAGEVRNRSSNHSAVISSL